MGEFEIIASDSDGKIKKAFKSERKILKDKKGNPAGAKVKYYKNTKISKGKLKADLKFKEVKKAEAFVDEA